MISKLRVPRVEADETVKRLIVEVDALLARTDPGMHEEARVWIEVAYATLQNLFEGDEAENFMDIPRFVRDVRANPRAEVAKDLKAHRARLEITSGKMHLFRGPAPTDLRPDANVSPIANQVFLVHGHEELLRLKIELFLTRAGLAPVVLMDQPSGGATVIEKFERYASASAYAVVLLTCDDVGRARSAPQLLPRARQNVVLELGYFIGKLGRERVCILHESGIELPSDISGVVYVSLTDDWQDKLTMEMRSAGLTVNR